MADWRMARWMAIPLAIVAAMMVALALGGCGDSPAAPPFAFVDADGDLVADAPTDPAHFNDPDTLVFAYTPLEDPTTYAATWREFIDHLAKKTGRSVQFFAVHDNTAQLEAMRSGRLHVTGFNTGSVPKAVSECGFVPVCIMARVDGSFGYEMEIIVPANSPIQTPADLAGQSIAFTSRNSNSGFKAPSVLLAEKFNLRAETDYTAEFSGSHENSILGVARGHYKAAAIANEVQKRLVAEKQISADAVRSVFKSASFPTTAYGFAYNLPPALREQIRAAFFDFDWAGTGLEKEFTPNGLTQFIPITYNEHWAIVRDIDAALAKAAAE